MPNRLAFLDNRHAPAALRPGILALNTQEFSSHNGSTPLKDLLENVADGIITIDNMGTVLTFNTAAETIFGYKAYEVVGNNVRMLMPEPYHQEHDAYLRNYKQTGEKKILGQIREVEGRRKDGSQFPIDLAVNEMWIGEQRLFSGITRDITDRKHAEKAKNEFISIVNHELRTPLTSIRGSLGLLTGGIGGELPVQAKKLLEIADHNTERLLILINDLLHMEKIATGKMSFKFEPIVVMPLIRQSLKENEPYAKQHQTEFKITEAITDDRYIYADSDRLIQVMNNLLSNAAKFSPQNSIVEIAVNDSNCAIRINITDHGPGIPTEFQSRVFDKFTQSDASDTRKIGGTGLGMNISKTIIEKHGGKIGFTTKQNVGTTFYFELLEVHPQEKTSSALKLDETKNNLAASVLIIEDDPDVALLLRMMLVEAGYNADIAYNAAQAKKLLAENEYHSITLDIKLPDINGITFLKELHANNDIQHTPIVVISAITDTTKQQLEGGAVGVVDWLEKPINIDKLLCTIQNTTAHKYLPRILHVEDDPDIHAIISLLLKDYAYVIEASCLDTATQMLSESEINFDMVLLDVNLPDGSGIELLNYIKKTNPPIPTIIFSANEVDDKYREQVHAALTKASTSSTQLLNVILATLIEKNDMKENVANHDVIQTQGIN